MPKIFQKLAKEQAGKIPKSCGAADDHHSVNSTGMFIFCMHITIMCIMCLAGKKRRINCGQCERCKRDCVSSVKA